MDIAEGRVPVTLQHQPVPNHRHQPLTTPAPTQTPPSIFKQWKEKENNRLAALSSI